MQIKMKYYSKKDMQLFKWKSYFNSSLKIISCILFISFTLIAHSQTSKDYIKLLTAEREQLWRLDSITLNSNYAELKKEMVVLFKLNNKAIVFDGASQKKDTISWYLTKKERYAILSLGEIGQYEIDFLRKNNLRYMRLRNEITIQKNINITEYFFTPSKL